MRYPRRSVSGRRTRAIVVGDLLGGALRELGMPSARVTARVQAAWDRAADPTWRGDATPATLEGGVLGIEVRSAALREELAQFHRARLLDVLRAALPEIPLVGIRFTVASDPSRPPLLGDER